MGNYNSQYESYYSSLINKKKKKDYYNYKSNDSSIFKFDKNYIFKRLVRELIGVFILFIFVISCKTLVTPKTKEIYSYSKKIVNENLNYNSVLASAKTINLKSIEEKSINWIENIKTKLTGEKIIKNKINNEFILPVEGSIISKFGEEITNLNGEKKVHEGIDISINNNSEIICPYEGKVKSIGEDKSLGKYIIIDHGNGIETKYGALGDILVKNEELLSKGTVIGKSGSNNESKSPHLHFELMYMGENKNPEEYINFSQK
ncbi:Peptidase family M23 [Clostridium sp. USBA 49]|jgi:murein DD-endopeptidase MepM/ murein hydrolase activator NlpD|uniref:M23 family metallopeptidase n=1 Tax=Clostridium TaxID=1485 RepID=UPI00099A5F96|nr:MULTISPECIES: M23 family metallopeptidase [Clostridium]SKA75337.1 Peptidase family M23 [Clostridium sp. USBA 49]